MDVYGKIIWYIQQSLYRGKTPDDDGYYKFSRKELYEGAELSPSAFDSNKYCVIRFFSSECSLLRHGKYPEYASEMLYTDVKYDKGIFMFKRNPITLKPELQHLWALPPLGNNFAYDYFDDKHRRRTHGEQIYDAFPWSWTEEKIQEVLALRGNTVNPPINDYEEFKSKPAKTDEELRIDSIKRNGPSHLQNFKEENITYNMCFAAVSAHGSALRYVPKNLLTEELYILACESAGDMLRIIPEDFKSKRMCDIAVASDGLAIKYVPNRLITEDLCRLAIQENILAIKNVPEEILTEEFCISLIKLHGSAVLSVLPKALKNNKFYLTLIKEIPELIWNLPKSAHTVSICKAALKSMGYSKTVDAIRNNPKLLSQLHPSLYDHDTCLVFLNSGVIDKLPLYQIEKDYFLEQLLKWYDTCNILIDIAPSCISHISEDILSYEMCLNAVKKDSYVIKNIPNKFKTEEISLLAFENNVYRIEDIPEQFITYEMCLKAVKNSKYLFSRIPKKFKTKELCMVVLKIDGKYLNEIPVELRDEEICYTAFKNMHGHSYYDLEFVPLDVRSHKICEEAIKCGGHNIKYVPDDIITYELCLTAVKSTPEASKDIPERFFTKELCLEILKDLDYGFKYIPKHCLTEKICLVAIGKGDERHGTVIEQIPIELRTAKMYEKAVEICPYSLDCVPEDLISEAMIINVALKKPLKLKFDLPKKFQNKNFISKLISINPVCEEYLSKYLLDK